jgi:hypothetical protein
LKENHEEYLNCRANYSEVDERVRNYSLASFSNPRLVSEYDLDFGISDILNNVYSTNSKSRSEGLHISVSPNEQEPFHPEIEDLCRLHYLCLKRKAINVLEFGSGYSTLVIVNALNILSECFSEWVGRNVRCQVPFHVYSVEEDQRFADLTLSRITDSQRRYATISRSSVEMTLHDGRIATVYSTLPNISPDIIYLDGPSQYATTSQINGISIDNVVRMPMAADILRFEFFLEPGTFIIVDGRTQNARFLKSYLRRDWKYLHDVAGDTHYFELQETPLGYFNEQKIRFCLNGEWLL